MNKVTCVFTSCGRFELLKVTIDDILLTTRNKMTQIWVERTDKTRGYYREPTRIEILKKWFKITIIDCKKDIK